MYHFSYGSNLSLEFLKDHCPNARFVLKAYLPNFEVQFRFWSKSRNGGISSIILKPGELVHGVIYDISKEETEALDVLESVPDGLYKRETFKVIGEDRGWYDVEVYHVSNPEGPFIPSKEYVETMITGAKQHGIDPEYIKKLETILSRSQ